MAIDEQKVDKMVNELEHLTFFNRETRFPKSFYMLNDEEKAEVVRRYRIKSGVGNKKKGLE